jgi:predicted O-linked N-acetylglucosamine transferase (SPINDLY family)
MGVNGFYYGPVSTKGDPIAQVHALLEAAKPEAASAMLLRMVQREPKNALYLDLLSEAFYRMGDAVKSIYYRERALAIEPDNLPLMLRASMSLSKGGRSNDALQLVRRAHKLYPEDASTAGWLIGMLNDAHELDEAMSVAENASESVKADAEFAMAHADTLFRLGRVERAVEIMRSSVGRMEMLLPNMAGKYAGTVIYSPDATAREVMIAHDLFGRSLMNSASYAPIRHVPGGDPERRLHVGLISPDFREHSVSYFVRAIIEGLDRTQFSVSLYYTGAGADSVTQALATRADRFIHAPSPMPQHLAGQLAADKVDIALELAGITRGHALETMYLNPCPVQVSYLGYPATTGVRSIGYRIVDSITDPPGEPFVSDKHHTEKLVRIDPCFLCYTPNEQASKLEPVAARVDGSRPFTFGSFNAPMKLNDRLLETWGKLLSRVPGSRLCVKFGMFRTSADKHNWDGRLERAGIAHDRVVLMERSPSHVEHMKCYHEIDLALDTFPYHGTTTTCEALLMGVPVVTRAGRLHLSRVGLSLLSNVGLSELVAHDEESYINLAASLASNPERLAGLRGSATRQKLLNSAVCDQAAYAARFGAALRSIWRERCAAIN